MNLELTACLWLSGEKRCMIVVREFCPRSGYCGEPDAYGVTCARYGIEVEVKRSMSDFYADKRKHSRRNRDLWPDRAPKLFYYMMEDDLAVKAVSSLPEWAGLLGVNKYGCVTVVVEAPPNKQSKRLSIKECVRLSCQMSVFATRMQEQADVWKRKWNQIYEPYYWTYEI